MSLPIRYQIRPIDPKLHLFEVVLTVQEPDPMGQSFTLPAWIPGSYMIRDFAKNIVSLEANHAGDPINATKTDKQTWLFPPASGPLQLRYIVYAWDLSVRSAHLDNTHAYFNGTSVFLSVSGQEEAPCEVVILPPEGDEFVDWKVATAMTPLSAQARSFGHYQAANYDELIDHPVEMGNLTFIEFKACGVPHEMAIYGRHNADEERLAKDLTTVCEHHIRFFGEPAPMDHYLFMVMAVGDGYGGLEHRASTSLLCKREDLPHKNDPGVSDGYRNFLGLCSHEYFHTWNVKRIKPAVYSPYDLSKETYTPLLWAFEGITSHYDDLCLVRTGLITPESYLELLGKTLTRNLRGTGHLKQTVTESSYDTWTKFYKQDENAPNAIVSYYTKGAAIALCLDLTIRQMTQDKKSLDDVMLQLWKRHGNKGVNNQTIQEIAAEIAGDNLDTFFDLALNTTHPLPLDSLLSHIGIEYHTRPATDQNDLGGKPSSENTTPLTIGARLVSNNMGMKISHVAEHGPAHLAGLSAGDELIAADGLRITKNTFGKDLEKHHQGDNIKIQFFRRDELMHTSLSIQATPENTVYLTQKPDQKITEQYFFPS